MKIMFLFKGIILFSTILLCLSTMSFSDGGAKEATDEYKIKLAIIERVIIHVEWAKGARVFDTTKPFYFGIYGDVSPFGENLLGLKNDRKLKWKDVEIQFFETPEDFNKNFPDLIFIPKEYSDFTAQVSEKLKDQPTLIVTDEDGLEKKGAMVSIFMKEDKMKVKLNTESLFNKGFKVSDELLRLVQN